MYRIKKGNRGITTDMDRFPGVARQIRIQLTFLVLHVTVNVKELFTLGRLYPWPFIAGVFYYMCAYRV